MSCADELGGPLSHKGDAVTDEGSTERPLHRAFPAAVRVHYPSALRTLHAPTAARAEHEPRGKPTPGASLPSKHGLNSTGCLGGATATASYWRAEILRVYGPTPGS